jgi:cytidyltransferase-like protein
MKSHDKKVCISGYFNPIHKGHINYISHACELGSSLTVIVNNDLQIKLKGSKPFQSLEERMLIVSHIKGVDRVFPSVDTDKTICNTLEIIRPDIFAKGGDSTRENTPEVKLCRKLGIKVIFNVGGKKIQSSSWLKGGKKCTKS